jgi:hypothetical protein
MWQIRIKIRVKIRGKIRGKGHVNNRSKCATKGTAILVVNLRQIFYDLYSEFCRDFG